MTIGVVWREL